jgi:hypothetical protein
MFSRALPYREAALLLAIFSNGACIKAQERGYLDTTQVQIRQRQREPSTGSSGGVISGYTEGKMQAAQSLALSLKISDHAEFVSGEAFEYQVQIQNISDQPVEFPWDLSSADIEPTDPHLSYQFETAAIYIHAKLRDNRAVSLEASILLFGSSSIGSTIVKLQPGEWVRIKANGRAVPANPSAPWPPSDLASKEVEGTLTATLILYANSFSPAAGGHSHEESRTTKGPISSNASTVQFHF